MSLHAKYEDETDELVSPTHIAGHTLEVSGDGIQVQDVPVMFERVLPEEDPFRNEVLGKPYFEEPKIAALYYEPNAPIQVKTAKDLPPKPMVELAGTKHLTDLPLQQQRSGEFVTDLGDLNLLPPTMKVKLHPKKTVVYPENLQRALGRWEKRLNKEKE